MKVKTMLLCNFVMAAFVSATAQAEIYKYKDANGNWQFSDKPPQHEQRVEKIAVDTVAATGLPQDLAERLTQKFSPKSAIQRATLAVVSIETQLGSGSGFFVSDQGHIVTNRHVVRPTQNRQWQETADSFDEAEQRLQEAELKLARRQSQLEEMKAEIERYKKSIPGYSEREKGLANSELKLYQDRYNNMKQDYDQAKLKLSQQKRELSRQSSDFSMKSGVAQFASQFKITLKDGSKLTARLVKVSKKYDLALLKLDSYITPQLDINASMTASQGMSVYAIGSPLGMKDFVTSGIITGVRSGNIVTDTQILPGNSGGPLLDGDANVLGVNTQKLLSTSSIGSEGFGVSIPVSAVREEFAAELN